MMKQIAASLLSLATLLFCAPPVLANDIDTGQTRIVVPSHDIPRGTIIADSDLSYATAPASQLFSGVVTSMNDLDGMESRRVLRANEPVRNDDVRHPILVTKGSMVTMTFAEPGITLTASGKAMTEGGLGETVTILNPVSYRQITGVVTGAGIVRAGDVTSIANSAQIASIQP